MLQPMAYPEDYSPVQKLSVLEKQAKALNQEQNFYRVPQTTFFHDGVNNAGVQMKASTGSGQDCTGVNDGSKNSVLMNYIPDAWNWGAEIFCECEVRYVHRDRDGNGYIVFFAWHGYKRQEFEDHFYSDLMWVRAVSASFVFQQDDTRGLTTVTEGVLFPWSWCFRNNRNSVKISETRSEDIAKHRAKTLR